MRLASQLFALVVVSAVAIACGSSDVEGDRLANADMDAESSLFKLGLGADGCGVEIPDLGDGFLSALPDCAGGQGKCVPPSPMMDANMSKQLAPCDTGSCVPLAFLKIKTQPLKKCTSYGNAEGVCVTRAIPTVEKLSFLPQDQCKPDERCAPCANPLDGKPTGICELGKPPTKPADQCKKEPPKIACPHQGKPVLDVTKLTACAPTGMHCMPKSVVPAGFASLLAPCPDNAGLCAPDKAIQTNGQFIPKTCSSVGGAEGRCLHAQIPQVAAQSKFLPSEGCDPDEKCIPCFDPITGEALPSCKVACDPGPQKPAMVFPKCAEERGRCVPTSAVPANMQKNLKTMECKEGTEVCAPFTAIDRNAKPQACEVKMLGISRPGPGVCIENVLKIGLVLSQSNCADGFKCTPCNNPLEGNASTGLPGCPN